jgi:flagellar basal-body rod modification protein FlgD
MQVNSTNSAITKQDAAQSGDTSSALPTQTLNQDDFLKLLVAQLQAQDPMNPESDTEFVSQMANFTTLEQSKEMTTDIQQLGSQQQLQQANDLIGRTVTLGNADGSLTSGTVTGILVQSGVPSLIVNGQAYDMSTLLAIAPTTSNPAPVSSTSAQGA